MTFSIVISIHFLPYKVKRTVKKRAHANPSQNSSSFPFERVCVCLFDKDLTFRASLIFPSQRHRATLHSVRCALQDSLIVFGRLSKHIETIVLKDDDDNNNNWRPTTIIFDHQRYHKNDEWNDNERFGISPTPTQDSSSVRHSSLATNCARSWFVASGWPSKTVGTCKDTLTKVPWRAWICWRHLFANYTNNHSSLSHTPQNRLGRRRSDSVGHCQGQNFASCSRPTRRSAPRQLRRCYGH